MFKETNRPKNISQFGRFYDGKNNKIVDTILTFIHNIVHCTKFNTKRDDIEKNYEQDIQENPDLKEKYKVIKEKELAKIDQKEKKYIAKQLENVKAYTKNCTRTLYLGKDVERAAFKVPRSKLLSLVAPIKYRNIIFISINSETLLYLEDYLNDIETLIDEFNIKTNENYHFDNKLFQEFDDGNKTFSCRLNFKKWSKENNEYVIVDHPILRMTEDVSEGEYNIPIDPEKLRHDNLTIQLGAGSEISGKIILKYSVTTDNTICVKAEFEILRVHKWVEKKTELDEFHDDDELNDDFENDPELE